MHISKSYPFLALSRITGVPYGALLALSDCLAGNCSDRCKMWHDHVRKLDPDRLTVLWGVLEQIRIGGNIEPEGYHIPDDFGNVLMGNTNITPRVRERLNQLTRVLALGMAGKRKKAQQEEGRIEGIELVIISF